MLFRLLTFLVGATLAINAQATYMSSSNFVSSLEGDLADYYRVTEDDAHEIVFSPVKSMVYTHEGEMIEESFVQDSAESLYTTNSLIRWNNATGSLKLHGFGQGEMTYRHRKALFPFNAAFGKVTISEDVVNGILQDVYRAKFSNLINMRGANKLSLRPISNSVSVGDIWMSEVHCTHIVNEWVKDVGYFKRGLKCTSEFVLEFSINLTLY